MASYTEILHFTASEEVMSGRANLNRVRELLSKAEGLNQSYFGPETEDPSVLFIVNDWKSKDAHTKFLDSLEGAAFKPALSPLSSSPIVHHFAEFDEVKSRLQAPITEFVTLTLKADNKMEELKPLVQDLHEKLKGSKMFYGSSWAPIANESNMYHGILGWDTVEAHWDAVKDGPPKAVVDEFKKIANLWLVHAALQSLTEDK
ncbi:hypothetical protein F5J12DRAFT_302549 [Pisolithus orientalis]|uniref:uncharacterized protein n=1 Tax=Pisolithus orientalis TaxID=936130 RepID=UPI0022246761|nr:uncharacterized protein F5J12DRAFT_302549 [Pisolithus orientalis]KAI6030657.1 hypothetical protein F5J12DRAFT_302549 [Pisolithus orientalis]